MASNKRVKSLLNSWQECIGLLLIPSGRLDCCCKFVQKSAHNSATPGATTKGGDLRRTWWLIRVCGIHRKESSEHQTKTNISLLHRWICHLTLKHKRNRGLFFSSFLFFLSRNASTGFQRTWWWSLLCKPVKVIAGLVSKLYYLPITERKVVLACYFRAPFNRAPMKTGTR